MTRYLLDANTLSIMARDPRGAAVRRARQVGFHTLCTSIVVVGEIRFGLLLKGSHSLAASMEDVLARLAIESFEKPAEERYAEVRLDLHRRGSLIGSNDMLIAAHALALDCTIVTANTGEFSRVPDLRIENWCI